jgi:hypothetical protein
LVGRSAAAAPLSPEGAAGRALQASASAGADSPRSPRNSSGTSQPAKAGFTGGLPKPWGRNDTAPRHGPIEACRTSNIPSTTGLPPSPPAGASALNGGRSISARCSPARPSESNKPTSGFGSSALWIMISDTSTTRPAGSNLLQIPSDQKCYLCRRYKP